MPTPLENIYAAAETIMAAAALAAQPQWIATQATTNFGTDFKITAGRAVYQIRLQPLESYHRGTLDYPRATVTVLVHHHRNSSANEDAFVHHGLDYVWTYLFTESLWSAESGVFGFDPEEEQEISDGERVGNVISFEVTVTVLATGA